MKARKQRSNITSKVFKTRDIVDNFSEFCIPRKRTRLSKFNFLFPEFLDACEDGRPAVSYHHYLDTRNRKGRAEKIMKAEYEQFKDIKENGLRRPLDMVVMNGEYVLMRGYRRLFMLDKLGYKEIPARVFKSLAHYRKLEPPTEPQGWLDEIGCKHFQARLDQATDKYWLHGYLPQYQAHIGKPKSILEIGVLNGASLDLWKDAFPEAKLYGLDLKDRNLPYQVFIGGQDSKVLAAGVEKYGPFDLIVDDASHQPDHTLRTFELYFPMCSKCYVIEDLNMNYRGGKCTGSLMQRIHKLIDEMNISCDVKGIHLYHNIVFIEKL